MFAQKQVGRVTGLGKMAFQDSFVTWADSVGLPDDVILATLNDEHPPKSWLPTAAWLRDLRRDLGRGIRGSARTKTEAWKLARVAAATPVPVAPPLPLPRPGESLGAWARRLAAEEEAEIEASFGEGMAACGD